MTVKKRTKAEIQAFRTAWAERNARLLELAQNAHAESDRRKSTQS
jgi:hypothetical protein